MSKKHSPDPSQREMRRDVWLQASCPVCASIEGWRCVGPKGRVRFACHQERWDNWRAKQNESSTPKEPMVNPKGITSKQANRMTAKAKALANNPVTKAVRDSRVSTEPLSEEAAQDIKMHALAMRCAAEHPEQYMLDAWQPHGWVMAAIHAAYSEGCSQGMSESDAKHNLIHGLVAETAEGQQTTIIRATVAAVIESIFKDHHDESKRIKPNLSLGGMLCDVEVTMDLDAQRTIWDRYELSTRRNEDNNAVIFNLSMKG